MRNLWLVVVLLLISVPCFSRERLSGWCEDGNQAVSTLGYPSSTKVQRSYPNCTLIVYLAGTVTLASIFADNAGTAKANPFIAANSGEWFFYADPGRYDIRYSDGGISAPFTRGDVIISAVETDSAGNGSMIGNLFIGATFPAACSGAVQAIVATNYKRRYWGNGVSAGRSLEMPLISQVMMES